MSLSGIMKNILVPINKEGYPFIFVFIIFTILFSYIWLPLLFVGLVLVLWCIYFFRDPERTTPINKGLIVSPADGVVLHVKDDINPPSDVGIDRKFTRIAIFMNVFDVHVNRSPVSGDVLGSYYHEGQFLNASLDKASERNERLSLHVSLKDYDDKEIIFTQIAGLVARRIKGWKINKGESLEVGERYGMIRFGSRVDVYLPEGSKPMVLPGQKTLAGETIIARIGDLEDELLSRTK